MIRQHDLPRLREITHDLVSDGYLTVAEAAEVFAHWEFRAWVAEVGAQDAVLLHEAAKLGIRNALRRDFERSGRYRRCERCSDPLEDVDILRGVPGFQGFRFIVGECRCGESTCIPDAL